MSLEKSRIREVLFKDFLSLLSKFVEINEHEINSSFYILVCHVDDVGDRIIALVDPFNENKGSKIYAYVEENELIEYIRSRFLENRRATFKVVLLIERVNNEIIPKVTWLEELQQFEDVRNNYKKVITFLEKFQKR